MHLPHVVAFCAWLVGWALLFRLPRLPRRRVKPHEGTVTVVIPARNEAASIPNLLSDLDRHRPAGTRVLVADDHSEDGTADVARSFPFVQLVSVPPLEAGWTGKAWACHAGAERAAPGMLVFLDADVRLHDDALSLVLQLSRASGGLLSVWPYHLVRRPYEHLSALFNVTAFMASGAGSLVPCRRPRAAFGPVIVTSRDDYHRAGGHHAVRGDVVDDFALARAYDRVGLPVCVYSGGRSIAFRMYPDGLRSLIDGWTKNFAAGALSVSKIRVLLIGFWMWCALGALTWAAGIPHVNSIVLGLLFALQMTVFFKQVGRFSVIDGLLYPLHIAFFLAVFLRSLVRTLVLRRVTWRGRSIPLQDASSKPE